MTSTWNSGPDTRVSKIRVFSAQGLQCRDRLYDFHVGFCLTQSGTECVADYVCREVRYNNRLSPLTLGKLFFSVVSPASKDLDCFIYRCRCMKRSVFSNKQESGDTVNLHDVVNSRFFLIPLLFKESLPHLIKHRNRSNTVFGLRLCACKFTCKAVIAIRSIGKRVMDKYRIILKIDITPLNCKRFSDSYACSEHECKHRLPLKTSLV